MPQPKIGLERIFVIDTSALIDIKRWYLPEVFPDIWKNLEIMIQNDELIAPMEVLREVEKGDDELKIWCRTHRDMFIDVEEDMRILAAFKDVQAEYDREEWERNIQKEFWADPWVIALALSTEYIRSDGKRKHPIIVTSENQTKRNKIPTIAREFELKSIKVPEFMKYVLGGKSE